MKTITRRSHVPRDGERGSATLENVIIFPVVILFIFGVFQAAIWLHARDVAHGAATAAYHAARTLDGSAGAGHTAGMAAITAANGTVESPNVTVSRTAETVVVTVTGSVSMTVPGFPGSTVSETVTGPVERYVAP
ncbi:TadE family protein [Agromyces bauzanensis]